MNKQNVSAETRSVEELAWVEMNAADDNAVRARLRIMTARARCHAAPRGAANVRTRRARVVRRPAAKTGTSDSDGEPSSGLALAAGSAL